MFTEAERNLTSLKTGTNGYAILDGAIMEALNDALVSVRRILRATDIRSKKLAKESGLTTSKLLVLQTIAEEGEVTNKLSCTGRSLRYL